MRTSELSILSIMSILQQRKYSSERVTIHNYDHNSERVNPHYSMLINSERRSLVPNDNCSIRLIPFLNHFLYI